MAGLILTRRQGQKIMIGDEITIEVLGHREDQASLRIIAPDVLSVDREEIYLKKKKIARGAFEMLCQEEKSGFA